MSGNRLPQSLRDLASIRTEACGEVQRVAVPASDKRFMRVIVRRWIPDDPAKADAILEMVERKALELAGERASGLELTLACTAATVWAATQFRLASADQLGGEA